MSIMNATVTLRVKVRRFYQTGYLNDYYHILSDDEKDTLISKLEVNDKFRESLRIYMFNTGEFGGEANIGNVVYNEKVGKDNKRYLVMCVDIKIVNHDNYTGKYIRKIINECINHYANSGPSLIWSEPKYYKIIDQDYDALKGTDLESDQIEVCSEGMYEELRRKYAGTDMFFKIVPSKGEGECTYEIENIEIENEEYWDKNGTNVCQLKRECKCHENTHYMYIYLDSNMEDLVQSGCLIGEDTSPEGLKKQMMQKWFCIPIIRGENERYYRITDINHNKIIEGIA